MIDPEDEDLEDDVNDIETTPEQDHAYWRDLFNRTRMEYDDES